MRAALGVVLVLLAAGCAGRSAGRITPGAAGPATSSVSLESSDAGLRVALAAALAAPSPGSLRAVAAAYDRRGVFDRAYEALEEARRLDPRDAVTHDALARLWRNARMPHLALGDAYRAIHAAPGWATAYNTLGTVFQALGRQDAARGQYQLAIELDPGAAYAINNLCYAELLAGRPAEAALLCRRALQADPALTAATNNLALAEAAAGRRTVSRRTFALAGDPAAASYNDGIVHLARREFVSAVAAFESAQRLRPEFALAVARAQQARQLVIQEARR
jgi:Flp pilus assembly protein TadD